MIILKVMPTGKIFYLYIFMRSINIIYFITYLKLSINTLKHGLEEEILDPLDSTEPYVFPDVIGESLAHSEPKLTALTKKSQPRYS